ncbi:MAG: 7-cyano-7-deazaguanine synthase QueC [Gemmatimonadota bacterium]
MTGPPAVVLLSGGLDSATTLAIARAEGFDAYALSFRYGQRHAVEIDAAATIAAQLHAARHVVLDIDLRTFGGSALTADIPVPTGRSPDQMAAAIPVTYVPARNTIFLAYATAWAEVLGSRHIFIGVNAVDYSGYPDCRARFIRAFEATANLATRAGTELGRTLEIRTPLIDLTKAEIIRRGLALGVDYGATRSCYQPDREGRACGACDACLIRLNGFAEVGVVDPGDYQGGEAAGRQGGR